MNRVSLGSRLGRLVMAVGLVMAAGLAIPESVTAQDPDFESRVPPEVLSVVRPVLQQASADGLPVSALQAKVLEGMAKRVPAQRIGEVVAGLAGEFRAVRAGLQEQLPSVALTDPELVAAAMASRQGVPTDALARVWQSRPDASTMEVPVTVLGELVRRGVPIPDAVGVMSHVVNSRVPMNVAAQIPGRFDGARGPDTPPGAALGQALRMLNIPDPPIRGKGRGPGG